MSSNGKLNQSIVQMVDNFVLLPTHFSRTQTENSGGITMVLVVAEPGISTRFFFTFSVPLAGKDKAVEVKCVSTLVSLLKDEDSDVRANAAGAIMM